MIHCLVNCAIRTCWNLFWPKIFIIEHCFQTKFFISDFHTIFQHMSHILNKIISLLSICLQNLRNFDKKHAIRSKSNLKLFQVEIRKDLYMNSLCWTSLCHLIDSSCVKILLPVVTTWGCSVDLYGVNYQEHCENVKIAKLRYQKLN